jgi:hypothetical protein
MKKNGRKIKSKEPKVRFLTGPEVDMLKTFGKNWESVIEDCYNKIYQSIEKEQFIVELRFNTIRQRNAVKSYFLYQKFATHCSPSNLTLQILL